MQLKKHFSLPVLMILVLSMMSSPSLTVAQDTPILQTGDEFSYYSEDSHGFANDFYSELYNFSNGNDLVVTSEHRDEYMRGDGWTDVTIVSDPNPPFMPDIALGLIIDQELKVTEGEYYEERFVNDTFSPERNVNESHSEPRDGHFMHFRDTVYAGANSTYAIIPHELVSQEMGAPFPPLPPNFFADVSIPENPQAELINRYVMSGNATYDVNGAPMFFDTMNISSEYYYGYEQEFTTMIPFGPEDDPNTQWIEANGTLYYDYYAYFEYIFDADTGVMLERFQYDDLVVWGNIANDQFMLDNIPDWDVSLWMDFHSSNWFEQYMEIDFASSFFGNSKPTSSGTNRLEQGDAMIYKTEGGSDFVASFDFSSPDSSFASSVDSHVDASGEGIIDVYYHEPGFFKAVLTHSGSFNGETVEEENGDVFTEPISGDFFELEVFETRSNDSYEITPFYELEMWIDYPWYREQRDEETPSFLFGLPDRVPIESVEEYIDYLNYTINGFEYLVEAEIIEINYHLDETFRSFFQEANIDLSMDIEADGRITFVYDSWTGVLLEQSEEMNVQVSGAPAVSPSLDQSDISVDISMTLDDSNSFELASHPHEYQSEQTEFPEVPDDGSNATDTNTTGSDPGEDTEPSLDLPLPFLPTLISLGFIAVYMRRRG